MASTGQPAVLGLRANAAQFSLLVLVNAFVGGMAGMERSILPVIAEREFQIAARTGILSFILVFGLAKAITNYFAGRFSDRFGRKHILVAGWIAAIPVPFLLMWAPDWNWILAANALLGISQGLTWSTTVIMKIDLVGSRRRGLAMGMNEAAGYIAAAAAALATGWIAAQYGLRPQPFYLGIAFVGLGLMLSAFAVRDTSGHVEAETALKPEARARSAAEVFRLTTWRDRNLSSVTQAGLVNNLNDGMAWGLFPLVFASAGMNLGQIGILAAIYPAVWGMAQLGTGALSDSVGRKWLIVFGMFVQALGIAIVAITSDFSGFAFGAAVLGLGTAMVYPTLLAAIGDVAEPSWRASAVGVYRLWRDLGYAIGALIAGFSADLFGLAGALWVVTALTAMSGAVAALRMREPGSITFQLLGKEDVMTVANVDRAALEAKVKDMYTEVAETPHGEFHFEMGRIMAERLGYAPADLDRIPSEAIDSFAGVGHFFHLAALQPGERVVDLGSGSGMDTFIASLKIGARGRVLGIDMTDAQLAKARRLANAGDFQNITYRQSYIDDTGLEAATFDCVISNGVINLAPDKARVFREAARLLRQGGRLAIADIVTEQPLPEGVVCNADLWAACIGGAAQQTDYRSEIEAAGLRIEVFEANAHYQFISDRAKGAASKWGVKSVSILARKP